MKDVTILYQGGSGGFALYYYLLLSGQYQFSIETVHDMIAQQFPAELIGNQHKWKNSEFWPNNIELKKTTGPKLFLICNPLFNPDCYQMNQWISNNTYKILLYTDIHLQLRMAYEKKAYWFTDISRQHFAAPDNTKHYLQQIVNSSKSYNHSQVDPAVLEVINKFEPDQIVNLKDFARTTQLDNFSRPAQVQVDFLNHWKTLQPPKAKIC